MRRVWFADEDAGDDGDSDDGGKGDPDTSEFSPEAQAEIDRLRNHLATAQKEAADRRGTISELKGRVDALEKRRQEGMSAEEQLKEAQQKIAQLTTDLTDYQKDREVLRQINQARLEQLPEHLRGLVPTDQLSERDVAAYLTNNHDVLSRPVAPKPDGGSGRSGSKPTLSAEEQSIATKLGLTDDDLAALDE